MSRKKTVSPYVNGENWDLCKSFGFNMSEEIDRLMETLIAIRLEETHDQGAQVRTVRVKLEEQLKLIDKKREEVEERITKVKKREKRFKLSLKTIEKNREYSNGIKELNVIIRECQYSVEEVMKDERYEAVEKKLQRFGRWTKSDLNGQIIKFRKIVEGY